MFFQICMDYASLPNPLELSLAEIRWFYRGRVGDLLEHTHPKNQVKIPKLR